MIVDEYLHPVARMFEGVSDLDARLTDERLGMAMLVEEMRLDLPIELGVVTHESGRVELASAPPTQHVQTTYMPVFHRLRLTVTPDGDR